MDIQYGIQITTTQTLTHYGLGLVDGVIKWTTGRPARDDWKEGVLSKGDIAPVEQAIDITRGGSYATMSGTSICTRFAIDGVPVWKIIKDLGLNLVQAEASLYCWRDGVERLEWTGRVADTEGAADVFRITFMDSFRAIHKTVARTKVNDTAFPSAPAASIGEVVPVTLGYATHAKLLNVSSEATAIECTTLGTTNYKVVAASAYNESTLAVTLKTGRMEFEANDTRLVGKFLSVFKGPSTKQSIRILSNTASSGTGADTGVTVVTLDDAFDITGFTNDTHATTGILWSSGHGPQIWWFEINNFEASLVVSELPISAMELNEEGRTILKYHDTAIGRYRDVSDLVGSVDFDDIETLGYPGVSIVTKRIDVSGEVRVYFKIAPTQIDFISLNQGADWDTVSGSHSSSRNNLIDANDATSVAISATLFSAGAVTDDSLALTYDLHIPESAIEAEYEGYFVLMDQTVQATEAHPTTSAQVTVTLNIFGRDIYGATTSEVADDLLLDTGVFSTNTTEVNTLPPLYYGEEGSSAEFYAHKDNLDAVSLLDTFKAQVAYPIIRVRIDLLADFSGNITPDFDMTWTIREIGVVGQKTLNVIEDDLFVKAQGETYQSTWGSRKTSGNLVSSPIDILEHLIREYDGAPDVIDTESFDNVNIDEGKYLWSCGRQITEETETFALAQELARFGCFGIIPKANGKRGVKSWIGGGTPVAGHGNTAIIQGSMSGREPTSLADIFNEIQVNYAFNPVTGKPAKFIRITRIDEAAFPEESDPEWKTYAIGFPSDEYASAKICWDLCHLSYTRYGFIRPLPQEMQDCTWGPDMEGEWEDWWGASIAANYLISMCYWTPFRKDVITYSLPNTVTHAARELLDYVIVNDADATGGVNENGWIIRKAMVPGDGQDGKDHIELSVMLEPDTGD